MMEITELEYPERIREYIYADGDSLEFTDIVKVGKTASGFHKLESTDGEKYIVAPGWRVIYIDTDEWSF